jgi:hypothetical protein
MNYKKLFKSSIDILHLDTSNWELKLFTILNITKKRGQKVDFDEGSVVLLKILDIVEKLKCQTIIIEKDYLDRDYLEEYANFYCKSFESYSSRTHRLHFFKDYINFEDLEGLASKEYLGYSIVRPIDSYRSGRTILPPPYDDVKKSFIACKTEYYASLLGSNLKIIGTPFIQQDSNVNVCAQASMWIASYYMHQKYGYPRYYPPVITEFATKTISIGSPKQGLDPVQVVTALRDMGYRIACFDLNSSENSYTSINSVLIYSYIRSKFPVILVIETSPRIYHAICLVGYKYDFNSTSFSKDIFCANNIKYFYYQDDAVGPYRKLYKYSPNHSKKLNKKEAENFFSIKKNGRIVIVPMLKEISLQADEVYVRIPTLLDPKFLNTYIGKFLNEKGAIFSKEELSDLVCRFFIKASAEFKSTLPKEMDPYLTLIYKAMPLPKYIYILELTKKSLIKDSLREKKPCKIIGEIVLDSTADRNDSGTRSFLAIHICGRLIIREPRKPYDNISMPYWNPDEKSYSNEF